ncbi:alpha/beta fold hydrolase [Saccharopolyspora hordei]|uniref:Pimeloyl-ACP methyl ester carboxylesterase n=1 Tax=Saccharopolyspora hordei TaxID=1838 RepID=A0A853AS13_9PSEU|nr:alpha/beta hydrolase [Saccharopolyspora hordei]NYI84437.1 pimeloyl-ACP methyl ester carboxylesterase [Saccharopolyspora hordei]
MPGYDNLSRLDLSYREDAPRIRTREGVELYYETRGEGIAIVLLNPLFLPAPSWRVFTEELEQQYRLIGFDLCNHGASSHHDEEPTWEEHAADVVGLLDALGVESAYMIGASTSTVLARDLARWYPDRVRGVVLAGPVFGPHGMRRQRQVQKAWLRTLENHGITALYEHMYPEVFSSAMNEALGAPGFLGFREAFSALSTVEDLKNGMKRAMQDDHSPELLAQVAVPALVVIGDDDFLMGPTEARELAEQFPNGRCEVMPKAGHVPYVDDAETFQALVRKFIDEVESHA